MSLSLVSFLPQTHNLILIMRKAPNSNGETSTKHLTSSQIFQDHQKQGNSKKLSDVQSIRRHNDEMESWNRKRTLSKN